MNFATQAGGRRVISPLIPSARNTYTSSVLKTQKMSITASFSTELIILKLLSHLTGTMRSMRTQLYFGQMVQTTA